MDLDKIRNMSDEELRKFLNKRIQKKEWQVCVKCGKDTYSKNERVGLYVYKGCYVQNYKLCNLCLYCYSDLLDYLGVNDID